MSDDAYGATVAKRRLSRRLTELRRASGHTANHVCDLLDWGRGKVGRFEANHWKRPEMSDIRDLLRVYGVDTDVREEIEDLAIRARTRPWWRDCCPIPTWRPSPAARSRSRSSRACTAAWTCPRLTRPTRRASERC